MPREIPIIFSTEMIPLIISGYKKQTRRLIKKDPESLLSIEKNIRVLGQDNDWDKWRFEWDSGDYSFVKCRYGEHGDTLYVRETWGWVPTGKGETIGYKATPPPYMQNKWKPSIHMPKDIARIFLTNQRVRSQRLQEISDKDCLAEGIKEFTKDNKLSKFGLENWEWATMPLTPVDAYHRLWDSIHPPKYSWEVNPWVWVIDFKNKKDYASK